MSLSDLIAPAAAALSVTYAAMNGASAVISSRAAVMADDFLTVRSIHVDSVKAGEPVTMQIDRTIHRPFAAEWSVVVRTVTPDGLKQHCAAAFPARDYDPKAMLPVPVTLDWWTADQCAPLPVGQHLVTTTWTVKAGTDIPISYTSNVFEVTE